MLAASPLRSLLSFPTGLLFFFFLGGGLVCCFACSISYCFWNLKKRENFFFPPKPHIHIPAPALAGAERRTVVPVDRLHETRTCLQSCSAIRAKRSRHSRSSDAPSFVLRTGYPVNAGEKSVVWALKKEEEREQQQQRQRKKKRKKAEEHRVHHNQCPSPHADRWNQDKKDALSERSLENASSFLGILSSVKSTVLPPLRAWMHATHRYMCAHVNISCVSDMYSNLENKQKERTGCLGKGEITQKKKQ